MPTEPTVFDALALIADLDDALLGAETGVAITEPEQRQHMIHEHLQRMDKLNYIVPDFKKNLDWLNVSESLSLSGKLKGHIVILDFFTYCCINCMHILPDLETLEERHPPSTGVAVIGVHSAKFLNEKVTANILSAVLRFNIHHAIINDSEASLWQELSISCWPTLVFVSPLGQYLYSLAGEGHLNKILEFVAVTKDFYTSQGQINPQLLPIHLELEKRQESTLSFPGKIYFWKEQEWLVISDSGHHRIIITDVTGVVQEVIGCGSRGFKDGNFAEASFSSPQGVACWDNFIYIADTENHAVRAVDLANRTVTTLTGTGAQGMDKEGGKVNTDQEISSPWDIALGRSPENNKGIFTPDVLFIAVAGTHQIWVYFLQAAAWYKNRQYPKGTCVRYAGSGREENRNNSYPEKASFAQPSGLALCQTKNILYVADSESSSIRSISLKDGKVSAVVGGERDPMNLFAFGDVDAKGVMAKLQHPLGVTLQTPDGPLLVADSYNHKIKAVNIETQECTTLAGTGQAGNRIHQKDLTLCQLSEPGGLACDASQGTIYIADTNNSAIKIIDIKFGSMSELPIIFPKKEKHSNYAEKKLRENDNSKLECLPPVNILANARNFTIEIGITLSEGHHFNVDAPNGYRIEALDECEIDLSKLISTAKRKGKIALSKLSDGAEGKIEINITLPEEILCKGIFAFKLNIQYFLCLDEGNVCLPPKMLQFKQVVHVE